MTKEHDEWFDELFGDEKYSDTKNIKDEPETAAPIDDGTNPLKKQVEDGNRQMQPKKKNRGKVFEKLVKDSAEKQFIDCERLKDAGYTGQDEDGKRFTITNLADFVLFDGHRQLWLEAKTTDTSFKFDFRQRKAMTRKSNKKQSQMLRSGGRQMIGLLIEFKRDGVPFDLWYVDIDDLNEMDDLIDKKSFNIKDLNKFWVEAESCNTYQVGMYKPPRARKDYIDIEGMFDHE